MGVGWVVGGGESRGALFEERTSGKGEKEQKQQEIIDICENTTIHIYKKPSLTPYFREK